MKKWRRKRGWLGLLGGFWVDLEEGLEVERRVRWHGVVEIGEFYMYLVSWLVTRKYLRPSLPLGLAGAHSRL